jgi:hypothetical protein
MINQLDINDIKLFLSESNRQREERFLRGITDNYKNKLIFSQNTCTDGDLVQVNPSHPFIHNLKTVYKVLQELGARLTLTTWLILKIFSRGGTAHEAFHILFTDFRTLERMNREFNNKHFFKRKIMHDIMNIGEDSFIELAGINFLPGLEFYITFSNFLAYENTPALEEIEAKCKKKELPWINLFLHWAMMYAIIGKVKGTIKNTIVKNHIKKTAPIFDKIRHEKNCNKRYDYAKEIYLIVEDLVEEAIRDYNMPDFDYFKNKNMPKLKEALNTDVDIKKDFDCRGSQSSQNQQSDNENQDGQSNGNGSSNEQKSKENKEKKGSGQDKKDDNQKRDAKDKKQENNTNGQDSEDDKDVKSQNGNTNDIDEGVDSQDNKKDSINIDENANAGENSQSDENKTDESDAEKELQKKQEELDKLLKELEEEKNSVEKDEDIRQRMEKNEEELERKLQRELSKVQYSQLHRNIRIETNKRFQALANQEIIYERIYNQHCGLIQRFANMFLKLIKDQDDSWESKLILGSMLDTRRLADPKRNFWKKEVDKKEVADLSIQLLIDGSGSMVDKIYEVIQATIILYEVAKKINIPICIVEERAIYGTPKVVHNVLVDYRNYKDQNTKYNLLHLTADGGTREGVSLKWVSAYQDLQPNKDKLLIVLADGNPEHAYGGQSYTGRISASDTKMVADQIERKGTKIISISLGENCYPYLQQIYKNTILCDDLTKLPDQMIRILKKCMFK